MSNTPVSKVVNVTIGTSPTFPKRKGFGLLLILGSSNILPVAERTRTYADIDGVAADFGVDTEEYKAAQIFFSQKPRPVELSIGRRFAAAVAGQLLGSVNYEKTLAVFVVGAIDRVAEAFGGWNNVLRITTTLLGLMLAKNVGGWIIGMVGAIGKLVMGFRGLMTVLSGFAVWPVLIGATAIAIALLIDDLMTFREGGESVIGDLVKQFPELLPVINSISLLCRSCTMLRWFSRRRWSE